MEVASSSDDESANAQRVAASTGEMATTIAAVGRHEETAEMAREAVRKTELSDQRMVGWRSRRSGSAAWVS